MPASTSPLRALLRGPSTIHPRPFTAVRRHHATPARRWPQKDEPQDREALDPRKEEYSKSGGGDEAAADQSEAAFDPNKTDPESAKNTAGRGRGSGGNPLDVSPANKDISQPKAGGKEVSGGREKADKDRRSGGGRSE